MLLPLIKHLSNTTELWIQFDHTCVPVPSIHADQFALRPLKWHGFTIYEHEGVLRADCDGPDMK